MTRPPLALDFGACLVARAGEALTCPACGTVQRLFVSDAYGPYPAEWDIEPPSKAGPLACPCGALYGAWSLRGTAMIHLASGWRDLGGE